MELRIFCALDLEFNQPSRRVIQVGACLGSLGELETSWVSRQWLLDPGEPISPEITALTGISDADIAQRAVPWAVMASEFGALLSQPVFVNPVTWGVGDAEALREGLAAREIRFPFLGRRSVDVKTFHSMIAFARGKNPSGGLRSVMGQYGLQFQGEAHRADVDARNTLRLFARLVARQTVLEGVAQQVRKL